MIHAFALEPELIATWGGGAEHRWVYANFGLGTPRVMLEVPSFRQWKHAVLRAVEELGLSEMKRKRVEELLRFFREHRCRRLDLVYDKVRSWLENTEDEYDRVWFKGILATGNPREHPGVMVSTSIDPSDARWHCPQAATPARTAEALIDVLGAMLANCSVVHLIDPYFGLENARRRNVLLALIERLPSREIEVHVHCTVRKEAPVSPPRAFFEENAKRTISRLPSNVTVKFWRWKKKGGGERLHNRYVLTDIGGVSLGGGLDSGEPGETDDVSLLMREQYLTRWEQYAMNGGSFELIDAPAAIRGTRRPRAHERGR